MVRIILIFSFLIVNIYGNKIFEKNLAVFSKFDGNAVLIKWVIPNLDKNYTYKLYRTNNQNKVLLSTLKKKPFSEVKDKFDKDALIALYPYKNTATLEQKLERKIFLNDVQDLMPSIISSRTDLAKAFGTFYEDKTVRLKQKYSYEIEVLENDKKVLSKTFDMYTYKRAISPTPLALEAKEDLDGINLTWQFDSLFYGYNIYIKKSPSKQFVKLNKVPISINTQGDLFYKDRTLKKLEVAQYKITTVDFFGEESAFSNTVTGYFKGDLSTPKVKYLNASINNSRVKLLWNKSKDSKTFYNVYRSNLVNGKYEKLNKKELTSNFYVDKTIDAGKNYYYYITAISFLGESKPSSKKLVSALDVVAPNKVNNLKANVKLGKINLVWDKSKNKDILGYRVYYAMDKDDKYYARVNKKEIKDNKYTHDLPKNLSRFNYYYKVTAVDKRFNESDDSNIIKVKLPDVIAPKQPVFSVYRVYSNKIYLQWAPIYDYDLSHYNIYTQEGTRLVKLNSKKLLKTQFELVNYKLRGMKKFIVTAVDKSGNESIKDKHILLSEKDTKAPIIKNINYVKTEDGIEISLDINDKDYNGFEVYRSSGKSLSFYKISNFIKIKSYIDKTLSKDTKQWYQLWVYDKAGNIKKSDTKEILWKN